MVDVMDFEDWDEFVAKYGDIEVEFVYYYKYTFHFKGEYDGKDVECSVGGNASDVYYVDVKPNVKYTVKELRPMSLAIDGEIVYLDI